jgi:hypothetical protein
VGVTGGEDWRDRFQLQAVRLDSRRPIDSSRPVVRSKGIALREGIVSNVPKVVGSHAVAESLLGVPAGDGQCPRPEKLQESIAAEP